MTNLAATNDIPERSKWAYLAAFIPVGVFAAVAMFLAIGLTNDPHKLPSTMIDKPMPDFVLEPIAPGATVLTNSDLFGEISLVNVFGSWCKSCIVEHPTLMRLNEQGVIKIYGVDWRDKLGAGQAWLDRFGDPYTRTGADAESRLAIDLGVTGAPETFLIDAQGRIRYKHVGPITEDVWEDIFVPLLREVETVTQ